ncbi:hypothetical protein [Streptomyces canus]|uniref:hypothetical protein n=1 Tax=Streptomyces canus TaxID=58343 RepID=UPI003715E392
MRSGTNYVCPGTALNRQEEPPPLAPSKGSFIMPETAMPSLLAIDVWADGNKGRRPCPGCGGRFPLWSRILVDDDFVVLTHDGDMICPSDPNFGYSVCEDCKGTGASIDDDGSVTGVIGSEIPCSCALLADVPQTTFPVEIGPEDEPIPGYRTQTFSPAPDTHAAVAA